MFCRQGIKTSENSGFDFISNSFPGAPPATTAGLFADESICALFLSI
jgi:hypothetical protein